MKYIKRVIFLSIIFALLLITLTSATSGDRDKTITETNVIYEIIPDQQVVHVSKDVTFTNYDTETRYWQGYYSNINYYLPQNVININIHDSIGEMKFKMMQQYDSCYILDFNKKVWYGENHTFHIEYDIPINKNTAVFYVKESGDINNISVLVPIDYEAHVGRDDYTLKEISDSILYTFEQNNSTYKSFLVDAVRKTDLYSIQDVAHLKEKDVAIEVKYYEGEDEWADDVLRTSIETLEILENITGMNYPMRYNITITQATLTETGGYGGSNNGRNGIYLLHTEGHETLIHELSHYWTRACEFEYIWMDEGCADLYTYLVLDQTYPEDAYSRKNFFFETYNTMEKNHELSLSSWTVPSTIDKENFKEVDYGYKKAFVTMYNIYEEEGLTTIQDSESLYKQIQDNYEKNN